jgi:hypothetical protein
MTERRFQNTPPHRRPESLDELIDIVEQLIQENNILWSYIEEDQRQQVVLETGATSTSFESRRLSDLLPSSESTDAVTRGEIEALGLPIGRPSREWRPSGRVVASNGLRVPQAFYRDDAIPLWQSSVVASNTIAGGDLGMPSIRDSDPVDLQGRDGVRGTTKGTLLFAVATEDEARARPVRATPSGVVIDSTSMEELLLLMLEKLDEISSKL